MTRINRNYDITSIRMMNGIINCAKEHNESMHTIEYHIHTGVKINTEKFLKSIEGIIDTWRKEQEEKK